MYLVAAKIHQSCQSHHIIFDTGAAPVDTWCGEIRGLESQERMQPRTTTVSLVTSLS